MVMNLKLLPEPLDSDTVAQRIDDLREAHAPYMAERIRIRQIMNGGIDGIRALLGEKAAAKLDTTDIPVVHLMDSGLTRLAQRLRLAPDIKVDVTVDAKKTDRRNAEKRERILAALDYQTRLDLTLPYAGRWLPGYAYVPWVIMEGKGRNGQPYAKAEIRNSFDCYPGQWGPDSQPVEIAFIRLASKRRLAQRYPNYAEALKSRKARSATWANGPFYGGSGGIWQPGRMAWEGPGAVDAVLLGEYMDASGTYLMAMDERMILEYVPNPLRSGPAFSFARRPSFDLLKGQYDHVIGLMSMMAKLNYLAYIANKDAVYRETNIIGDIIGKEYKRGRGVQNFFTPGTRIERPSSDISFQVFTQIDRIERQLRIGTNYSVVQDSESPNAYATGRGLDKLTDSASANVGEYQDQMRYALELIDMKRLEWEEAMYGGRKKTITGNVKGAAIREEYVPTKDIDGKYESRRVYGVMAGWDQPDVIVTGLQLLQAEALDVETFQDNLHGLENKTEINKRVRSKKAEDRLFDMLSSQAAEKDPRASAAMVEIMADPDKMSEILSEFYAQEEPEEANALAALMGGGAPGGPGAGGPPPPVQTTLARLMSGGQSDLGVQTVGRLAG